MQDRMQNDETRLVNLEVELKRLATALEALRFGGPAAMREAAEVVARYRRVVRAVLGFAS